MIQKFKDFFSGKKEVHNCETCGEELNYDSPVFLIDNKLFHNRANCIWGYSKKTGRTIKGKQSYMTLKDAIKNLK